MRKCSLTLTLALSSDFHSQSTHNHSAAVFCDLRSTASSFECFLIVLESDCQAVTVASCHEHNSFLTSASCKLKAADDSQNQRLHNFLLFDPQKAQSLTIHKCFNLRPPLSIGARGCNDIRQRRMQIGHVNLFAVPIILIILSPAPERL